MASTSVVLPWSTWAMIATLRRSARAAIGLLRHFRCGGTKDSTSWGLCRCDSAHSSRLVVVERFDDLGLGVHDERPVPDHRLPQRTPRQDHQLDTVGTGVHADPVT